MIFLSKAEKGKWLKIITLFIFSVSVALIIGGVLYLGGKRVPDKAECGEIGEYSLMAENEAQEWEFLQQFGLTPDVDSIREDTVVIPTDFNDVYSEYNRLQIKTGLNLEPYRGVSAKRRIYTLEYFDSGDSRADNGADNSRDNSRDNSGYGSGNGGEYSVTLLVFRGRVIGGHISSGIYGEENLTLLGEPLQ